MRGAEQAAAPAETAESVCAMSPVASKSGLERSDEGGAEAKRQQQEIIDYEV